jgi:hypothetical protein
LKSVEICLNSPKFGNEDSASNSLMKPSDIPVRAQPGPLTDWSWLWETPKYLLLKATSNTQSQPFVARNWQLHSVMKSRCTRMQVSCDLKSTLNGALSLKKWDPWIPSSTSRDPWGRF